MTDIKFPPKCDPFTRDMNDACLEDHLTGIFYYFSSYSNSRDNIVEYCNLWRELNDIGKMGNASVAPAIATCAATEILINWIKNFARVEKPYADCFFDLYRNVIKNLKTMSVGTKNFIWKYNLLQTWESKELFRLDAVDKRMNETVVEQLFTDMFQALLDLGCRWENTDKVLDYVRGGLDQLVLSSPKVGRSSLKTILMPLVVGNAGIRLLIRGCISKLNSRQCQFLCSIISRRILLNQGCDVFDNLELHVAEKLLFIIDNFEVFEPLILVVNKASLNVFHRDHERVVRILVVLLIRYMEKHFNEPWESIELDTRKKIQLMASRFKSAMVNSYSKLYPHVLLIYGTKLLSVASNMELKFRFLQIFQFYIKHCRGGARDQLMTIFDTNIN